MMQIFVSLSKAEKDIAKGDTYLINVGTPKKPLLYVGEVTKVVGSRITFRYNGTATRGKLIELGKGTSKIIEKTKRKKTHKPLSASQATKVLGKLSGTAVEPKAVKVKDMTASKKQKHLISLISDASKVIRLPSSKIKGMFFAVQSKGIRILDSKPDGFGSIFLTSKDLLPLDVSDMVTFLTKHKAIEGLPSKTKATKVKGVTKKKKNNEAETAWMTKAIKNSHTAIGLNSLPTEEEYEQAHSLGQQIQTGRKGPTGLAYILAVGKRDDQSPLTLLMYTKRGDTLSQKVGPSKEAFTDLLFKYLGRHVGPRLPYSKYKKMFASMVGSLAFRKDKSDKANLRSENKLRELNISNTDIGKIAQIEFSNGAFHKEILGFDFAQHKFAVRGSGTKKRWLEMWRILKIV